MTVYASDTFTDTDGVAVTAHTPNAGGPWHSDMADSSIQSGKVQNGDFTNSLLYCDSALTSDDCAVSIDVNLLRTDWAAVGALSARRSSSGSSGYMAAWNTGAMEWEIWVDGTDKSIIATSTASPMSVGLTRNLLLRCVGDRISLEVDGSELCFVTDSSYPSLGRTGFYFEPLVHDAMLLDNFLIADAPTLPPPPLTGRGSVSIASPAWLHVVVTGLPGPATFGNAEPRNWYGVALLSWGTPEGLLTAHPITRDLELIPLPAGMTELHYWVAPGLSITVTERSTP